MAKDTKGEQELTEALRRLMDAVEKAKTKCFVNDSRSAYDILKAAQEEARQVLPDEVYDITGDEES